MPDRLDRKLRSSEPTLDLEWYAQRCEIRSQRSSTARRSRTRRRRARCGFPSDLERGDLHALVASEKPRHCRKALAPVRFLSSAMLMGEVNAFDLQEYNDRGSRRDSNLRPRAGAPRLA